MALLCLALSVAEAGCRQPVRNVAPREFDTYLETQVLTPWFRRRSTETALMPP